MNSYYNFVSRDQTKKQLISKSFYFFFFSNEVLRSFYNLYLEKSFENQIIVVSVRK